MTATGRSSVELADGALEKGRLARARRAGDVEREDAALGEPLPVLLGEQIVLLREPSAPARWSRCGGVAVVVMVVVVIVGRGSCRGGRVAGERDDGAVVAAAACCAHGQLTSIERIRRSRPASTSTSALPQGHSRIRSCNSNSSLTGAAAGRAGADVEVEQGAVGDRALRWPARSRTAWSRGRRRTARRPRRLTLCTRRPAACSHTASTTLCVIAISCMSVRSARAGDPTIGRSVRCDPVASVGVSA